jgi:hypothetical protein
MPFAQSERLLAIDTRWNAGDEAVAAIFALSRKYELVLYDPQGPDVFLPGDLLETGPIPPPTAWEWFKGIAIAAFLCGLTYAAWQIPIWWIQWPAVIIAGFVAAAGLFVVGAMIAGLVGLVDVNEGRAACARDESPR